METPFSIKNKSMIDKRTVSITPEHAGWISRGLSSSMSAACDRFLDSRGLRKTREEIKNEMFTRLRGEKKK